MSISKVTVPTGAATLLDKGAFGRSVYHFTAGAIVYIGSDAAVSGPAGDHPGMPLEAESVYSDSFLMGSCGIHSPIYAYQDSGSDIVVTVNRY